MEALPHARAKVSFGVAVHVETADQSSMTGSYLEIT